jgi:hypothetical protein
LIRVKNEEVRKLLSFSHEFDNEFAVATDERDRAFFGVDVLRGLIDGIETHVRDPRWGHSRLTRAGAAGLGRCGLMTMN